MMTNAIDSGLLAAPIMDSTKPLALQDPGPDLEYGKHYHIWKNGNYLGVAVWTRDYIGPYFENYFESPDHNRLLITYRPDRWEPA